MQLYFVPERFRICEQHARYTFSPHALLVAQVGFHKSRCSTPKCRAINNSCDTNLSVFGRTHKKGQSLGKVKGVCDFSGVRGGG